MAKRGSAMADIVVSSTPLHMGLGTGNPVTGVGVFADTTDRQNDYCFFEGSIQVPAATVLGTGTLLTLLTDAGATNGNSGRRVPKGYKITLTDARFWFTGATAWTGGTDIRLSDSNGVDFAIVTAAGAVQGGDYKFPSSASTAIASQTASAGAATTITGAGFTANALVGRWVVIDSGTGAGQARQITGNTTTVLTVPTWTVTPDNTSVFRVVSDPILGVITSTPGLGNQNYGTVDKGLVVRATGTFTTGSAFNVYVRGYFVKTASL